MASRIEKTNLESRRRKRIADSKLFDLVNGYRFARDDSTRSKRWGEIVLEVGRICDVESARAITHAVAE